MMASLGSRPNVPVESWPVRVILLIWAFPIVGECSVLFNMQIL